MGQIYFGDLAGKWVRFESALTITGRTLAEITQLATQLGYTARGPAYVHNALITRLLGNLGLSGGEYQEFTSLAAMPDVAILAVDYQGEASDLSRHVVWHHVRGTTDQSAFSYVVDPANWVGEKDWITSDFTHLKLNPAWYIEIVPKAKNGAKGK